LSKAFRTWKRALRRTKFKAATRSLLEQSCVLGEDNAAMRNYFLR
jgi:hypothetical protein